MATCAMRFMWARLMAHSSCARKYFFSPFRVTASKGRGAGHASQGSHCNGSSQGLATQWPISELMAAPSTIGSPSPPLTTSNGQYGSGVSPEKLFPSSSLASMTVFSGLSDICEGHRREAEPRPWCHFKKQPEHVFQQ